MWATLSMTPFTRAAAWMLLSGTGLLCRIPGLMMMNRLNFYYLMQVTVKKNTDQFCS
jgi:hypothetical protein